MGGGGEGLGKNVFQGQDKTHILKIRYTANAGLGEGVKNGKGGA